eukprot:174306_1
MASGENMVVVGFIRHIGSILNRQTLIPVTLIQMCHEYYSIKVWLHNKKHKMIVGYTLHSKSLILRPGFQLGKTERYQFFCCIPNISSIISGFNKIDHESIIPNQCYDAFFGLSTWGLFAAITFNIAPITFITLKLFRSNYTENKYINFDAKDTFHHYKSYINDFLYCNQHGIIYEYKNDLYHLDVANIDLNSKQFAFTLLHGSHFRYGGSTQEQNYDTNYSLTMRYMHDNDTLFAMQIPRNDTLVYDADAAPNVAKCGIYSFAKNQWKIVSNFDYDGQKYKSNFQCVIAKNRYCYQQIYVLTNRGEVVNYNSGRNKWITLLNKYDNNMNFYEKKKRISLWLDDPNTLYYIGYPNIKIFDIRDPNKEWKNCDK